MLTSDDYGENAREHNKIGLSQPGSGWRVGSVQIDSPKSFALGVAVLAAGKSSRMGRPKLLLPWGRGSVLGHLVRTWRQLGARQIAVVCAAGDSAVPRELDRLAATDVCRIANPTPSRGMFSSIQCAAAWNGWCPDLTHHAVVLGDQPHVQTATLRRFLEQCECSAGTVFQPEFAGRLHHPVLFDRAAFHEVARSQAPTLRDHLSVKRVTRCPVVDAGLELDLDSPDDYERALRGFGTSAFEQDQ